MLAIRMSRIMSHFNSPSIIGTLGVSAVKVTVNVNGDISCTALRR
jgi:hypothetical protein